MRQMQWMHDATYLSSQERDNINAAILLTKQADSRARNRVNGDLEQQYVRMLSALEAIGPDSSIIIAAILYPYVNYADLSMEVVCESMGAEIAKLVAGTVKMAAIGNFAQYKQDSDNDYSHEQLRKMLLAMIEDVRIIIIKIAEQIACFQQAKEDVAWCQRLAQETRAMYAPLANRLGVSELKWLLEDYAFRYLETDAYQQIAKGLSQKRQEREIYADEFMVQLRGILADCGIKALSIQSRVKHIYSIYMKMRRKNKTLDEIYDQIAVRIIVPDVAKCYSTLSTIHAVYSSIGGEFDDYIASPKSNGYQSIHTAVYGADKRVVEIQIRTQHMHAFAESGVAAHWLYKERSQGTLSKQDKSAWLNNLLAWQQDVKVDGIEQPGLFANEVFAFTPNGDVKGLIKGSTVLDFAYAIHTQVGHGCKGAKVNGKMVPLTTLLKNGDVVEVLTSKTGVPSRDWLDGKNGYLRSGRARSKVQQWFRANDFSRHVHDGQQIIERELKKNPVFKKVGLHKLVIESPYDNSEQLCAAVARGEYSVAALVRILDQLTAIATQDEEAVPVRQKSISNTSDILSGNVLSRISLCCKPTPGDNVVGYVTVGRGISVHRRDCINIINLSEADKHRLIDVTWAEAHGGHFPIDLLVTTGESDTVVRDVNHCLSLQKVNLLSLQCFHIKNTVGLTIRLTVEVSNREETEAIIQKLSALPDVILVEKVR